MPFLKQQIDIINTKLREVALADKRFDGSSINGLASLANYQKDDKVLTAPVIMDGNYEPKWVGLDDTFPATIYHRAIGINYAQINNSSQFGRGVNKLQQTADILMVVFGKYDRLKLTSEQFEALITASFPDEVEQGTIAPYKLDSMLVTLIGSNLVGAQVYGGEYGGLPVYISAEDILFSVRYRIETQFRKNCFAICDCPPAGT